MARRNLVAGEKENNYRGNLQKLSAAVTCISCILAAARGGNRPIGPETRGI